MKSSLEEMLEALTRRDGPEVSGDSLPKLPSRPTSKARLPTSRWLPKRTEFPSWNAVTGKEKVKERENEPVHKMGSFGCKMMRKDDVEYFIDKELSVWCRMFTGEWMSGRIQSSTGDEAVVSLSNGNVVLASIGELLPANPDLLEGVDDISELCFLNEPSVLHNLHYRYSQNNIYSRAGPVLIAVNPFKEIPIYGSDFVTVYRQRLINTPHVFATANAAYYDMMKDGRNQSIIISGESGAGKTETAKYAMQYLATFGSGSVGMELGIIHSNHILEAFGNAKTSKNDNSSRFGKLIEINYSALGRIQGAKIQTYLLEKSRVVRLASSERSYHVFYQLCAGASSILRERLNLKMASEYCYLKQSDCLTIDGVDDAHKFDMLLEAMDILHIEKEDQENIFALLAAVLWLGNISFQVIDNENHIKVLANEAVTTAANLMGCSTEDLIEALSTRKIEVGKDAITRKLTFHQAINARDALAQIIYGSLFDWLVERISKSLIKEKQDSRRSISILDIYGFESFERNSFEQLCINYANERLQQHINRHLFELEMEKDELDGIDRAKVKFEDNKECLSLVEKNPLGLLSLLDEESNSPTATDLILAIKLKQHLSANRCFKREEGSAFGICHYAGEVTYDTNGFLVKNQDPVYTESIRLLSSCSCPLLQISASKMLKQTEEQVTPSPLGASDFKRQGVGTKFMSQLFKLMHHLENTTPHFIFCIKPNSRQLPDTYDMKLVLQQLRYCSVLEIVRISRSGYSIQMTHQEFSKRYGFLLLDGGVSWDPLSTSIALLKQFNVRPEMYQVSFTKLYIRSGQISAMEEKRNQFMQCVITVQKHFRGFQARCYYYELKNKVKTSQSLSHGMPVRKQFRDMVDCKKMNIENGETKTEPEKAVSAIKVLPQEQVQDLPSVVEELRKLISRVEMTVEQKEKENAALRKQLRQLEKRCSKYEENMKKMEEMSQNKMISLATDITVDQRENFDIASSRSYNDYEDAVSTISQAHNIITPGKFPNTIREAGRGQETNNASDVLYNLVKEFEQQKHTFDDDAKSLEAILKQSDSVSKYNDELRKLEYRFVTWTKEYKARLSVMKTRLRKLRKSGSERTGQLRKRCFCAC